MLTEDPSALVDEGGIAVHDACVRMVGEAGDGASDAVDGEAAVVAVHPADDLARARLERLVDGVTLPPVRLARPTDRAARLGEDLHRPVRGRAVDDDVLDARIRLSRDRLEAVAQKAALVERRCQDRDEPEVVVHGYVRSCLARTIIG